MTLRLATRGSALALAQSGHVADAVRAASGRDVTLVVVKTRGDQVQDRPLAEVGGKGLFTKEIEEVLLAGDADFAVHSMKDMPGEMPDGLVLGAVPRREDPRDVLVGARLADLPHGAIVGTGSLRRRLQLLARRPDLDVRGLRGNVDTRIRKCRDGEYAAVVLAAAGLNRLGRADEAAEALPVDVMIPAPAQGALAIQCRYDDGATRLALSSLHDFQTAACVAAERAFLIALSGGCSVPAACHARLIGDGKLEVRAWYAPDGDAGRADVRVVDVDEGEEAGRALAAALRP